MLNFILYYSNELFIRLKGKKKSGKQFYLLLPDFVMILPPNHRVHSSFKLVGEHNLEGLRFTEFFRHFNEHNVACCGGHIELFFVRYHHFAAFEVEHLSCNEVARDVEHTTFGLNGNGIFGVGSLADGSGKFRKVDDKYIALVATDNTYTIFVNLQLDFLTVLRHHGLAQVLVEHGNALSLIVGNGNLRRFAVFP